MKKFGENSSKLVRYRRTGEKPTVQVWSALEHDFV